MAISFGISVPLTHRFADTPYTQNRSPQAGARILSFSSVDNVAMMQTSVR